MLLQNIFKITVPKLAKNEFHATKFPDVSKTLGIIWYFP